MVDKSDIKVVKTRYSTSIVIVINIEMVIIISPFFFQSIRCGADPRPNPIVQFSVSICD